MADAAKPAVWADVDAIHLEDDAEFVAFWRPVFAAINAEKDTQVAILAELRAVRKLLERLAPHGDAITTRQEG